MQVVYAALFACKVQDESPHFKVPFGRACCRSG
jgi:hypothetical protein